MPEPEDAYKINGRGPLSLSTLEKLTQSAHPRSPQMPGKGNGATATKRKSLEDTTSTFPATSSPTKKRKDSHQDIAFQRASLPIWNAKDVLIENIKANDALVILGETGSGKTTQIPQFIMDAGLAGHGTIAITQPRKVAAITLAARVAAEQSTSIGGLVGYSVRFEEKADRFTKIKYMTDGMLGRELLSDPMLRKYSIIIVDEAHERTLRTDMLLTSLKSIIKARNAQNDTKQHFYPTGDGKPSSGKGKGKAKDPDALPPLKVIIMSATLDADRFSKFFNNAKILYVKGRQHPVKILHVAEPQADFVDSALRTFFQIHTEQPVGDVLIFLPGQEDIESLVNSIKSYAERIPPSHMQVLTCPMYAALSASAQTKVFVSAPPNTRKCIIATNIAETSITIPGVKYVIDSGLCKEKRYLARGRGNGVDALLTQPISQSSAMQRAGRAGREGEGWCFRLYTEQGYNSLRDAAVPEIQRCNLTFAILQMKCLGQNPETADFMDSPAQENIHASLALLLALSAIDVNNQVTPLGFQMSSFPLDPPQSRALLESSKYSSTGPLTSILALLSTSGKVLQETLDKDVAKEARLKFRHRSGDHMTLLNVLRAYEEVLGQDTPLANDDSVSAADASMDVVVTSKKTGPSNKSSRKAVKEWCKANYLNERSLKEALEIRKQLRTCCDRAKLEWNILSTNKEGDEMEEGILRSLLMGLWQNTALIQPDGTYRQAIGREPVKIHPSSTLFQKKCPAIVYDELVYTNNTYAMGVSSIPQAWLAEIPFLAGNFKNVPTET